MCQSPKIVNVLVQARTLPANDNNLLIEARTRSFQASTFTTAWQPFPGFLCVGALHLVQTVARLFEAAASWRALTLPG
jgi:hypothetical protein